jgi:hypothetical protein
MKVAKLNPAYGREHTSLKLARKTELLNKLKFKGNYISFAEGD